MKRPLRILHIFGRMDVGGAELRTLELMKAADRSHYHFQFCTLSGLPGRLDDEIRRLGGEVFPCPLDAVFPARFVALLRRVAPDVVHSHVHHASGLVLRLATWTGVPMRVAHFHSTGDGRPSTLRRRLQRAFMRRWIDAHATHVLAVSEAAMKSAWRADWRNDQRCRIVYDGFDTTRFHDLPPREEARRKLGFAQEEKLAIHVGSMQPAKNHLRLVDIFLQVARSEPSAHLLVVGRRDQRIEAAIRSRARAAKMADRIRILGERDDVPLLLRAANVLVFPSVREGLPGAVLEACAACTPVVASDLGGVLEIAAHFPEHVTPLPLSAPDPTWAAAITARWQEPAPTAPNCPIVGTVFDVRTCLELHCAVWEGSVNDRS